MENNESLNKNKIDKIIIIYDYFKSKEIKNDIIKIFEKELGETISREKLFGEKFVKNNKNKCKMIINGKKKDICSYLPKYHKYVKDGILKIELIGFENISDISYMFFGCLTLISLPNISKVNAKNITKIFFYCTSLLYLDDISKWEIKNIQDLSGIFQYCSSLKSLPDISKWNTENVISMHG